MLRYGKHAPTERQQMPPTPAPSMIAPMTSLPEESPPRRSWWLLAGVLMLIYLAVRLPGLMSLPIFGDEAIYLRWAQFARDGDLFRSLIDPKPPLHFWLIGSFLWTSDDPLKVARVISVGAGMFTIPLLLALCTSLDALIRQPRANFASRDRRHNEPVPPSGRIVGLVASVLMIFCPFLAFYQRLALADALVVLENVAILWLGLTLAQHALACSQAADPAPNPNRKSEIENQKSFPWGPVIAMGLAMGLALLTRQIVSYIFPLIAVWGFLLLRWNEPNRWRVVGRFAACLGAATVIALALWSPFFLGLPAGYHQDREPDQPITSASVLTEVRNRILYQSNFAPAGGLAQRLRQIGENAKRVFIPITPPNAPRHADYISGWLWVYLTPGVYLICLLGACWIVLRRQWRLLLFLLGWFSLLIGPLILLGTVSFSRYALTGVLPLLVIGAYAVVDFLGWVLQTSNSKSLTWASAAILAAALLLLPLRDLRLQAAQWQDQTLVGGTGVASDRYQYITGWTAGLGAQEAADFIKEMSRDRKVVVITQAGVWGNPADALWAYLENRSHLLLFCVDVHEKPADQRTPPSTDDPYVTPILQRGSHGGYLLRRRKWSYLPPEEFRLPAGAWVVVAVNDPVHAAGGMPATDYLRRWQSGEVTQTQSFPDPPLVSRDQHGEQVLLWIVGVVGEDGAILSLPPS